ncbi:MAG TPA: cholesterol oxidase substrate-binding domain-containing protein [Bryobacteraceae bacterium]|nr:cholesterol oxidase substrate-binding domain-containing protein [Bryobacteraceae bacterium]
MSQTPPNFPANIEVQQETFENWDGVINVPNVWTCAPKSGADVVTVCNWAVSEGYTVRARGIMHSWSPLTLVSGTPANAKVLLVDTTKYLTALKFIPASGNQSAQVNAQLGATMLQLMEFLEQQAGGKGAATGYSFPHIPAPGNLTVGGALAIDAHGSAVPSPADDFNASYGSLSNQILAFTAVVTNSANSTVYSLRTFQRGEGDDKAFLTHLGRAFLIDATLQIVDNYNLRCQSFTNIPNATLFQAPTASTPVPAGSVASYVAQTGRIEVICYPFTDTCWFKVWTNSPTQPSGSVAVNQPYNYPFSDNLPGWVTNLLKLVTSGDPSLTPTLSSAFMTITSLGLNNIFAPLNDLWGPSKDVLIYIKDTTLKVTANGYAVRLARTNLQKSIADFATEFNSLLKSYQGRNLYPVNAPFEIRVTSLDDPAKVAAKNAQSPVISALTPEPIDIQNQWDTAVWFDVLTLPGTSGENEFYSDLEAWFTNTFTGTYGRPYPEWSKGWAYTPTSGPWTNAAYMQTIRDSFTNWDWEVATLQKYDQGNLFTNALLTQLFVP